VLKPDRQDSSLLISYLTLRQAIGAVGLALPFALALGKVSLQGSGLEDSVSGYYYTVMRDVFVGSLCAIGVFLLSYRGYDRRDDIASNVACISALGVALFPTASGPAAPPREVLISHVHHGFAACLFLTLAYFSLVLFTQTDDPRGPQGRKRKRNAVYTACGWTILASMALIVVAFRLPPQSPVLTLDPVFWLESIAIMAFGLSWMTKGEAILKDVEDPDPATAVTLRVVASGDREIVMTREFDAPRALVFDAFTKPELVRRWLLGPDGWAMPVCEVDLRAGGAYRFVWKRDSDGSTMGVGGVYRVVSPPERTVHTETFDEAWYPGESVITTAFAEEAGRTRVTMTILYVSREARDGVLRSPMEGGVRRSYDRLAEILDRAKRSV
jgi:uncharacterized protein YndB with AHSA1/START domain